MMFPVVGKSDEYVSLKDDHFDIVSRGATLTPLCQQGRGGSARTRFTNMDS